MPGLRSARTTSACSAATSSTERMNSWCSRCALVITPIVGCAIAASSRVSPRWFMPISNTASRCGARNASSASGRPIALLKLPGVAATASSPTAARKIAAIISFVVVLPLLPVTTATGMSKRLRQNVASAPSECSGSSTAIRLPASVGARLCATSAAAAPDESACCTKSCPSKRSPRNATNKSPGARPRVSVVTRMNGTEAPMTKPPTAPAAVAVSIMRPADARARAQRRRRRRRAAVHRSFPDSPHGLSPRQRRRQPDAHRQAPARSRARGRARPSIRMRARRVLRECRRRSRGDPRRADCRW